MYTFFTPIAGDFVIVDPIVEGDKVKGEITHILYKEQIKYIKEEGCWWAARTWIYFDGLVQERHNSSM